jgi:2-keto-4-pentenoate hydratase/2-oxohepta-3-ene-1,7-dioic acid hydratase in catechol pathway
MVFDLPTLIAAVSAVHTLEPGDLLLTGTPEGVGPALPGDVITAGITELGLEITIPVVAAHSLD